MRRAAMAGKPDLNNVEALKELIRQVERQPKHMDR